MTEVLVVEQSEANSRFKLLVVARDPVGTGGGIVATETARRMAAMGHEVVFLSDYPLAVPLEMTTCKVMPLGEKLRQWSPRSKAASLVRHLVRLAAFSIYGRWYSGRLEGKGFVSIDHNLEAMGGDIVVLHNVFLAQAKADQRRWQVKILHWLSPVFIFRLIRELKVLRSSRVHSAICVSEQTLAEAAGILKAGIATPVIQSGIDTNRFAPSTEVERLRVRQEVGSSPEAFVTVFVGYEFERKRLDLVIKALALSAEHVVLWVVGGIFGSIEKYEALATRIGVRHRVVFLGKRSETEFIMQAADCLVLPSDYETWGLVALEAMGCGVPVLMTPVGCAPHVIREAETGFVVDYSADSIAAAIRRLDEDADLLAHMRIQSRREAERHDWDAVARAYLREVQYVHARKSSNVT